MINPQWFELPMSRTNFHGQKMLEPLRVDCIWKSVKLKKSFKMAKMDPSISPPIVMQAYSENHDPVNLSLWENSAITNWAQLFKTNDVICRRIVKTLIIKYGLYANIFAEKM